MYKKKTETAKKEYLKQLAAYRASLVSQVLLSLSASDSQPNMKADVSLFDFSFVLFRATTITLR